MQITALPPAPLPTDTTAEFNSKSYAHVASLARFVTEANELTSYVNGKEILVASHAASALASKTSAETSAATAAAQASAAAANTNAPRWVSGTTYAVGSLVYSPITGRSYRRSVAGAGTTDPSSDAANWTALMLEVTTGYPSIRPSLLLDFANTKSLDPRIAFSRASTATFYGADGLLKTAAAGVPRFHHNPATGESLGLLIEEQRTNLFIYSESFDNAAWGKQQITVTANQTTAPDGTLTADLMVDNTTSDQHLLPLSIGTVTSGTTYTLSCFAKAATNRYLLLTAFACGYQIFDLVTGAMSQIGSTGLSNGAMTNLGNGWYRCSVTITTQSTNGIFYFGLSNGTSNFYTGSGQGIYIWGAQLELGSSPTTYIPTVASQVTRSGDSPSMTGANFSSWYRQDEGTVCIDFFRENLISAGLFNCLFTIGDGSGNNRMIAFQYLGGGNRANFTGTVSSVEQWNLDSAETIVGVGSAGRLSASYKSNDIAMSVNSRSALSDSIASVPAVNAMTIGNQFGIDQFNGTIKRLAYYPKRISNTELQGVTA